MSSVDELDAIKALIGGGHHHEAMDRCRRLSEAEPPLSGDDEAELIYLLAVITGETEAFQESLPLYAQARSMLPARADVAYNHGVMLSKCGKIEDATAAWRDCIANKPNHRDALFNLSRAARDDGQMAMAIDLLGQLLSHHPGDAEASYALGNLHFIGRNWDDATVAFTRAVSLAPLHLNARINLGLTAQRRGESNTALAHYDQAIALSPDNVLAHVNRAQALLGLGRLAEGFAENEWRRHLLRHRFKVGDAAPWTGDDVDGKTVLLFAEQGQGDAIQFLRYAVPSRAMCARLIVQCHDSLVDIAAAVTGVDAAYGFDAALPAFDVYAPLMSLPHLLGLDNIEDIDGAAYIGPREGFDLGLPSSAFAVGIVWAGNPDHADDAARSCKLSDLEPITATPDVHLFSLQVGSSRAELQTSAGSGIIDLGAGFGNFSDTARAISALDAIVSVDTAVAHLAGAMGKPTLLMLPWAHDWRWFGNDERTPWYDSVRVFRQGENRAWEPVVRRAAMELGGLRR